MSQEHNQALRARYESISQGDLAAAFRDVHPDFELKTADRVPLAGIYRGAEAAARFLEDFLEPFEEASFEPEEFFEHGDRIVVLLVGRFRYEGSTAAVENRIGAVWTMRDGMPVRCEMFAERERALRAAGLSTRSVSEGRRR
jgi:ketosteroid isomerase-like protein